MEIEKKTWPKYFQQIVEGKKQFEIRLADFKVNEGDILILKEYDPTKKEYTGRVLNKKVNFVTHFNPIDAYDINDVKKLGLYGIGLSNENKKEGLSLSEAQRISYKTVEDWNKKHNCKHNKGTVFPHLVEEVGELAREINHHISDWREKPSKERLADEMADVIGQVLILATDYEVNIEEAFKNKIEKLNERFGLK